MRVAVTGATGFIGRYLVEVLLQAGHQLRCWYRPESDRSGIAEGDSGVDWVPGELGDEASVHRLLDGCDALVHAALWRPGTTFMGGEGDPVEFARRNIIGSLQLFDQSLAARFSRCVFISTCAVHDEILSDRPLDETHPLWAKTHYGAHKAALEKFVHSYGLGEKFPICALRPTGVYGVATPVNRSKWYPLVESVLSGREVECRKGGKEVHARDVARAVELLLRAPEEAIRGQSFNCYDRYVSQYDVVQLVSELAGIEPKVIGGQTRPQHQIETAKLRQLGFEFGGDQRLRETMAELVAAAQSSVSSESGTG